MSTTITLEDGYAPKRKTIARPTLTFRYMRGSELLTTQGEVWFATRHDGAAKRIRFNGAAKTWKTRPNIERPVKFGMYECGRVYASSPDAPVYLECGQPVLVLVGGAK